MQAATTCDVLMPAGTGNLLSSNCPDTTSTAFPGTRAASGMLVQQQALPAAAGGWSPQQDQHQLGQQALAMAAQVLQCQQHQLQQQHNMIDAAPRVGNAPKPTPAGPASTCHGRTSSAMPTASIAAAIQHDTEHTVAHALTAATGWTSAA